jgi:hypothetical protein
MIVSSFITGGLVFALFGATSEGGAAAFGIFYGFFSGGSEYNIINCTSTSSSLIFL